MENCTLSLAGEHTFNLPTGPVAYKASYMAKSSKPAWTPRNLILRALPRAQLNRLHKRLKLEPIVLRQILFDQGKPIANVYFLEEAVASVVGIMMDGSAVETATIGYEGMVGLPLFHGVTRSAAQAFCQVPGIAYRLSAEDFRSEIKRTGGRLNEMLGKYTEALFTMVAQSAACNRVHPMRERCARWLLQMHDRVGKDDFFLTHHFLSQMLGVRRATVTEAVGKLQRAGLIQYKMGSVRIVDRKGLEHSSCECYKIIRSEFDRLLRNGSTKNPIRQIKTAARGESLAKPSRPRGRRE
jgi:CRP-like cAMP-binding protein